MTGLCRTRHSNSILAANSHASKASGGKNEKSARLCSHSFLLSSYTNWSQQRIADTVGISQSKVHQILKQVDPKPHKTEYWCGKSPDPKFESKIKSRKAYPELRTTSSHSVFV